MSASTSTSYLYSISSAMCAIISFTRARRFSLNVRMVPAHDVRSGMTLVAPSAVTLPTDTTHTSLLSVLRRIIRSATATTESFMRLRMAAWPPTPFTVK